MVLFACHLALYLLVSMMGYQAPKGINSGLTDAFSMLAVVGVHIYLFFIEFMVRGKALLVIEIISSILLFCFLYFVMHWNLMPIGITIIYISALISIFIFYLPDLIFRLHKSRKGKTAFFL